MRPTKIIAFVDNHFDNYRAGRYIPAHLTTGATIMITLRFSNNTTRTFGTWCRPSVVQAYCDKHGVTAEIVSVTVP
jgi:hypothetical protein